MVNLLSKAGSRSRRKSARSSSSTVVAESALQYQYDIETWSPSQDKLSLYPSLAVCSYRVAKQHVSR